MKRNYGPLRDAAQAYAHARKRMGKFQLVVRPHGLSNEEMNELLRLKGFHDVAAQRLLDAAVTTYTDDQ